MTAFPGCCSDPSRSSFGFVKQAPDLARLALAGVRAGESLAPLESLGSLLALSLTFEGPRSPMIVDLNRVPSGVRELTLISSDKAVDVSLFPELDYLFVADRVVSIHGLETVQDLRALRVQSSALTAHQIAALRVPRTLRSFRLWSPRITDVSWLPELSDLEELDLTDCRQVRSLSGIHGLTTLRRVGLSGLDRLHDLTPLLDLPCLSEISCYGRRRADETTARLEASGVRVSGLMAS